MNAPGNDHGNGEASPPPTSAAITVLWATETGRARACARRAMRILRQQQQRQMQTLVEGSDDADGGGASATAAMAFRGRCAFDDFDLLLSLGRRDGQRRQEDGRRKGRRRRHFLLLFVSTTGDGEVPSTISKTWHRLLSKALPPFTFFSDVEFALFALGDRSYGPDAFCAAGRKVAARLAQLGARPACGVGYGDDGSPNGGVFADLDKWIDGELLPAVLSMGGEGSTSSSGDANYTLLAKGVNSNENGSETIGDVDFPYEVEVEVVPSSGDESNDEQAEWQREEFSRGYRDYFERSRPSASYRYDRNCTRIPQPSGEAASSGSASPLLGRVTANERITAEDWTQDTRHIRIRVAGSTGPTGGCEGSTSPPGDDANYSESSSLPQYRAGDVAAVLSSNPSPLVERFLSVLPPSVRAAADDVLHVRRRPDSSHAATSRPWPGRCTLRGLLTHCADLQSLPEREDLYALSAYCNAGHADGTDHREKLISLSESSGAALYGDYIIREKRNWVDVFYDFDSIRWEEGEEGSGGGGAPPPLSISHLLALLPSIAPRHFSIASSPSYTRLVSSKGGGGSDGVEEGKGFEIELCVAVVEGTTPLGRPYAGCCSRYLASIAPEDGKSGVGARRLDALCLWIHPGSFSGLPLGPSTEGRGDSATSSKFFETPIMCIGAGTGVAPLRSLVLEREARRSSHLGTLLPALAPPSSNSYTATDGADNILVFGCRKRAKDYYYAIEWEGLIRSARLRLIPAFSRDQKHKLYVQRALREADEGDLIARHILEEGGAVYVAGGSKMARAVKDEIIEALGARLEGGEKDAKKLLNRMKRAGLFSVEAWS